MRGKHIIFNFVVLLVTMGANPAGAFPAPLNASSTQFKSVGWDQKLGVQVPRDIRLRDEQGRTVPLASLLTSKPAVLVLAYYGCPNLCTQVLNGVVDGLRQLPFTAGEAFTVLVVSIDPRETPQLAAEKKKVYLKRYARPGTEPGWRFLTGSASQTARLASAIGFRYEYDSESDQYIHPGGITLLTSEGKIARYFFGVQYRARDLRLGLVEAAQHRIGSLLDEALLLCYHYDPSQGRYGPAIQSVTRWLGVATLLALGLLFNSLRAPRPKDDDRLWSFLGFPLFPLGASTVSAELDLIFILSLILCLLTLFAVFAALTYFSVRYRARNITDRSNSNPNATLLEIVWTVVPLSVFMMLFYWASQLYFTMNTPPPNALEIYVIGKQWMWKFQHPTGVREINELHIPVGRPVRLTMTSEDVIHSFSVPAFRIKHDILPGRYMTTWFEATRVGEYQLFCTQYCGTMHAAMGGRIIAMDPNVYAHWLDGAGHAGPVTSTTTPVASQPTRGRELFRRLGCVACHGPGGAGLATGPRLQGLFGSTVRLSNGTTVVADENYLRESILVPTAKVVQGFTPLMPSFQGRVSEQDLVDLISYIKALKLGQGG